MKNDKTVSLNLPKENKAKEKKMDISSRKKKMTRRADKRPGPKPKDRSRPNCRETEKLAPTKNPKVKSVSQRGKTIRSHSISNSSATLVDSTCNGCVNPCTVTNRLISLVFIGPPPYFDCLMSQRS